MSLSAESCQWSQERLDKAFVVNVPGFFHILWYAARAPIFFSDLACAEGTKGQKLERLEHVQCTAGALCTL